ncbi:hypothetical protein VR611_02115 [Aquirufa nivalisilvae]
MNYIFVIVVIVLGIFFLRFMKSRKNNLKTKEPAKANKDKYIDLINTLTFLDKILDRKLGLAESGVLLDIESFEQKVKLLYYLENNKLLIYGPDFTKEVMDIFDDPEIDEKRVLNMSSYVKNELVKLGRLVN